jgi:hypothetical protein
MIEAPPSARHRTTGGTVSIERIDLTIAGEIVSISCRGSARVRRDSLTHNFGKERARHGRRSGSPNGKRCLRLAPSSLADSLQDGQEGQHFSLSNRL